MQVKAEQTIKEIFKPEYGQGLDYLEWLLQDPKIINCGQNQMYLFSFFSEIAELQYLVQFMHSKLRQNIQSSVATISQYTVNVLG